MTRRLELPYAEALERIKAALKDQGFGVLTEIDVQATLHEKIGAEFRPYAILGACNPQLAKRALDVDLAVGVLLPCNVIVYEDAGGSVVSIFNPELGMAVLDAPGIRGIADEAKARLDRALAAV